MGRLRGSPSEQVSKQPGCLYRCGILVVVCFMCYYNSLSCSLVFQDKAILHNPDVTKETSIFTVFFNDFWGTPIKKVYNKVYRPLCILSLRWNYSVHGVDPMGYHLVNMFLHAIVSILFFKTGSKFLPELESFVAALLFTVHPVNTDTVVSIVGRAQLLCGMFFLLAFTIYGKATRSRNVTDWKWLLLCGFIVASAGLCNEQGVMLIPVFIFYELLIRQKLRVNDIKDLVTTFLQGKGELPSWIRPVVERSTPFLLVAVLLFCGKSQTGGEFSIEKLRNPVALSETPTRQLTYSYLVAINSWLLLFPSNLCCDWTGSLSLIESVVDYRNIGTITTFLFGLRLASCALSRSSGSTKVIIFSLLLIVFPPVYNLAYPTDFVISEKVLYIPSMGFCLLVASGWSRIYSMQKWTSCFLALMLLLNGSKTHLRSYDWKSDESIYTAGLRVNQANAKLYNGVGQALEEQDNHEEALAYYKRAVSTQEDDITGYINMGRVYNHLMLFIHAENAFLQAKMLLPDTSHPSESRDFHLAPVHFTIVLNLANLIARNTSRLEEAERLYRQAISMKEDYTQAYLNLGEILLTMNKTKEAQEVYERALFYDSTNPHIYYNLGMVLVKLEKPLQALVYFEKAVDLEPDHYEALLESAILRSEMIDSWQRVVAKQRLEMLIARNPSNERVYFHLGLIAMKQGDREEAESKFKKAIKLKRDFRSALYNIAVLLSEAGETLKALEYLQELGKYHHDHVKGLILMGDIYINDVNNFDMAENCYLCALKTEQDNVEALHNLCVVYVERGELRRAENCFFNVSQLAPEEEYIQRHLSIVRRRIKRLNENNYRNATSEEMIIEESQVEIHVNLLDLACRKLAD